MAEDAGPRNARGPKEPVPKPPVPKPIDRMEVDELAEAVRYHNWRYFALSSPVIPDEEFDRLTRRLRELAPEHPALDEILPEGLETESLEHAVPMLSLDKCYSRDEFEGWLFPPREKGRRFEGPLVETPKLDGVAAALRYDAAGRMSLALTRGDGFRGEVFTDNARYIDDVPKRLAGGAPGRPVEVRGEVYLRLSVFRTLEGGFSNPRNTAAGAIKQKDPAKTGAYRLSFAAYDVLGADLETEMDKQAWLASHGFAPIETRRVEDAAGAEQGYALWLSRRDSLDFEIDGVVYKADLVSEQRRLGATSHHPRAAIAWKFQGESAVSTLESVEWSVSRTGTITPVAIIAPVTLSGATVTRCSLHNLTILEELGLTLGARVVAVRRGGVIPHVEAVAEPGHTPVQLPFECPSCHGPVEVRTGTPDRAGRATKTLRCVRPETCPDAVRGTLDHFVKAAEIDGFGPKILSQLQACALVRSPADFYRLTAADLLPLERMGQVLAEKLVQNVQARRRLPLPTFLRALGIDDLGEVVSRVLAERCRDLHRVLGATVEDLEAIEGIGPIVARSVVDGLRLRRPLVDELLAAGVEIAPVESTPAASFDPSNPVAGRAFVFTGSLSIDRKEAQALVRSLGGRTPSDVSGEVDYLVAGEGPVGSKHKKAAKLAAEGSPIRVISEAEFLAMAGRPGQES